jgi:hypothetical protein
MSPEFRRAGNHARTTSKPRDFGFDGLVIGIIGVAAVGFSVWSILTGRAVSNAVVVTVLGVLLVDYVLLRSRVGAMTRTLSEMTEHGAVEVQETRKAMYAELIYSYSKAQKSIHIVSWKDLGQHVQSADGRSYIEATESFLRSRPDVMFQWLLWLPDHLDVIAGISPVLDKLENCQVRYFPYDKARDRTILPCLVIDSDVTNLGWGFVGLAAIEEANITIRQSEVAKLFEGYFNSLWGDATCVRVKEEGQSVNLTMVEEIARGARTSSGQVPGTAGDS